MKTLDKKIVFTNGCFDLLHQGHIDLLFKASKYGDKLIVGLNSDDSVKLLKGESRPVENQNKRRNKLLQLNYIDDVHIFNEETPLNLIHLIRPDILVKGGDYNINDITWLWHETTLEDKRIVENNQKGVLSKKYMPGPLSKMELGLEKLKSWYLKHLELSLKK